MIFIETILKFHRFDMCFGLVLGSINNCDDDKMDRNVKLKFIPPKLCLCIEKYWQSFHLTLEHVSLC